MSIDAAALAVSLRSLATSGQGHDSVVGALEQVLDACVALFDVDGAGILVADEQDLLRYVAASDGPGRVLEQTEAEAGEGPCTSAFVTAAVVTSRDLAAETERWPVLSRAMADLPVRAVLGTPCGSAVCRSARSTSTARSPTTGTTARSPHSRSTPR